MTRKPITPIIEKKINIKPLKKTLWEKLNSNGDLSNIIVQFTLAPFVIPYMFFKKLF